MIKHLRERGQYLFIYLFITKFQSTYIQIYIHTYETRIRLGPLLPSPISITMKVLEYDKEQDEGICLLLICCWLERRQSKSIK